VADLYYGEIVINTSKILDAIVFATKAHHGQMRKYTGDPYIVHPIEVASVVSIAPHTDEMIMAAILHDVVEDCDVSLERIRYRFGSVVEDYVFWLTDPPTVPGGPNRAQRKQKTRERFQIAPNEVHTIKCADLLCNGPSIFEHDPDFAKVYAREMAALLEVLDRGDEFLREMCYNMLNQYFGR